MPLPPVALAVCHDYATNTVADAVARLLSALGGLARFGLSGRKVLVKPNLLTDRPPEAAVTTHPEVIRAVVRQLRAAGARVTVGDSPASAVRLQQVWERTGVAALCAAEQVPLLNLEQGGSRAIHQNGHAFHVANAVLDADLIVNLPKVKTHVLMTLTCSLKNLYGVLPGYHKTQLHKAYPTPRSFAGLLRALPAQLPPQLCLADGVIGMEGDGPSNGTPRTLGFLAASEDPLALDLAICRVLHLDARRVPYLADLARAPIGDSGRLLGDNLATLGAPRLRLPSTWRSRLLPRPLVRLFAPWVWVRPAFTSACVACGRCVQACPVQALTLAPGERPLLNGAICIGCCCCHEVCPAQAIAMRCSPLLRLGGVFAELR